QGKIFPAVLKRVGKNTDIALLEIPGVQFKKFGTIATNPGHLTDNIFCLGDPKGEMPNSVTHGVISHEDRPNGINPKHHNVFQADCTVFFGNSGGAVLNENGEVIGIISYMEIGDEQEGSNYSFITKLEDIKDLLNG
ncbi:MAG TPA: trypsin-like peptidase domain-containing protein, partial [Allocoleopsis sp.]